MDEKIVVDRVEILKIQIQTISHVRLKNLTTSLRFSCLGAGCSKLTTSLVNVSLKFQMLISEICQYFLLKKCEKLLQCKSFSHFFNKRYQCI